jgi:hypothetical protein
MRPAALKRMLRRTAKRDADSETLTRVASALELQHRQLQQITKRLAHLEVAVDAVVRHAYVDLDVVPYPERLVAQRFRGHSQNTEDGIVVALFREAGVTNARFVEIGCGSNGGNSGFLAKELGWSGLMIDGSASSIARARLRFRPDRVDVAEAMVTRANVNELLAQHGIEGEIDFLSIDIDGNDYWILDALTTCSPRVLACEYNAWFGPERKVTVPYDETRTRERGSTYFGASLAALASLLGRRGFRLVAVEPRGANAFFLREDVAPHIPACAPSSVFRPLMAVGLQTDPDLSDKAVARLGKAEQRAQREREEGALELVDVD